MLRDAEQVHELLEHLADAMELEKADEIELLVCGGAGLQVLALVQRTTKDIDVVALVVDGKDQDPEPFPDAFERALLRVARDHNLPRDWLNYGPRESQRLGLPTDIVARSHLHAYGTLLRVRFLDRYDQIHFKLYAAVDQGKGKHLADLQKLQPTSEELRAAALWSMTHDTSGGYRMMLVEALRHLGFEEVANDIEG